MCTATLLILCEVDVMHTDLQHIVHSANQLCISAMHRLVAYVKAKISICNSMVLIAIWD